MCVSSLDPILQIQYRTLKQQETQNDKGSQHEQNARQEFRRIGIRLQCGSLVIDAAVVVVVVPTGRSVQGWNLRVVVVIGIGYSRAQSLLQGKGQSVTEGTAVVGGKGRYPERSSIVVVIVLRVAIVAGRCQVGSHGRRSGWSGRNAVKGVVASWDFAIAASKAQALSQSSGGDCRVVGRDSSR